MTNKEKLISTLEELLKVRTEKEIELVLRLVREFLDTVDQCR